MSKFPIDELRRLKGAIIPAYRQIADELRRVITVRQLEVGTKLPSEAQLVARFGVARMTAREALRVLKAEGVVRSEQGRGVFVEGGPTPKPVQMAQTASSNEGEWREHIYGVLVEGGGKVDVVDDPWAVAALRNQSGVISAIGVTIRPFPLLREESTLYVPGPAQGAHARAAGAVARAKQWVVSVRSRRDGEPMDLLVTRIGLDADDRPLIASKGFRAGSWPVTSMETIEA
ncbi:MULTISPECIES: GntR family transcriptional regulator [unclassified Rathayibacter]|uniref:GntR family transcriptional regulator n=1 Tax=unclassified Rathayibacter TaxID=2609250 RepID=UPI00188CFD71|nr:MULTISPECIES: winged helix-turn-helix domain-containing protein [unclassified Rathayibacter]MBF4463132.1 winged helix-turn-helix transcriptional regulator [Rathayibacter sp. VKM Ac-2879]MBF4504631.1 winged helix-turn-helix transcriptional regulator [Rathayibacter sp. VKM Ac-2878]